MKTSLPTCLAIAFLGLLATPAYSMDRMSVKNNASVLEGVTSFDIASGLSAVETNNQQLDYIDSINLLPKTTNFDSLLETNVNSDPSLSLTTENVGEPPTNSFQIPLIQF